MAEKIRITGKLLLIIVCTLCLIFLIHKDEKTFQLKQPQGEGITVDEVSLLLEVLTGGTQKFDEVLLQEGEGAYLNYESYLMLLEMLQIEDKENFLYQDKYRKSFYLLKEDWYQAYDAMLTLYGMEEVIQCKEIQMLAGDENLPDKKVGENHILASDGKIYRYCTKEAEECIFRTIRAYVADDIILTVREKTDVAFTLENVWVMEKEQEALRLFIMGYEIICPFVDGQEKVNRESVADITFKEGSIQKGESKKERINGRLLRISDSELELEGEGSFPIASGCKVYQLYEQLQEKQMDSLQLGYDFADYVIADGEICAVLILRKEDMKSIRVAVRSNQFASLFHETIEITADCDIKIVYGPYEERKENIIKAGEKIVLTDESDYISGDMVMIKPLALSGKMQVLSLERSQGIPSYRGILQVGKTEEGLTLVNEVLLEEYLYSVVPSEMPASYPKEALMAQAICARTYAYRYLMVPGLGDIGANVDDSVGYQVYNNIAENVNSTKAVKETAGQILFYDNEPVNTYYYSTSYGFGTDAGIWKESNVEEYPYLTSVHINSYENAAEDVTDEEYNGQIMRQEEKVSEYLLSDTKSDYEYEEPWYRWNYEVEDLNVLVLYERLYSRFHADRTKILKLTEGEAWEDDAVYESVEPEEFQEIYDMVCIERRDGGVMDELLLDTDSGVYKVISEYNIRYILNQGGEVIRKDSSSVACGQLLPSAYILIETIKKEDLIIGYKIVGGGYGHGVGMSQNGAKNMAIKGISSEEILNFFYPECALQKIY